VAEAEAAILRLAAAPTDDGVAVRDILLLRLRALLARAHGDHTGYRDYRDRYRDMARTLGFEGHMRWARRDAMTAFILYRWSWRHLFAVSGRVVPLVDRRPT
jgi:hypothetical protein